MIIGGYGINNLSFDIFPNEIKALENAIKQDKPLELSLIHISEPTRPY